jgi:23S rRNA pseudouridine1911/1915/1917 synthase
MKSCAKEIYEDNHLLVVVKPHGIATQPNFHEQMRAGRRFLHPVHRLDRVAGGLVLFAKSSKALSRLNELLRHHEIKKTYLARVEGHLQEQEAALNHFHAHESFRAKIAAHPFPGSKEVLLTYKVLEMDGKTSLLEIALHTGRYHQIRAQLSFIGHPIIGDKKYGSTLFAGENRIELVHHKMEFLHPVTKVLMQFSSDAG